MCKHRLGPLGAGLDAGVPAFVMSVIQLCDGHHSLGERCGQGCMQCRGITGRPASTFGCDTAGAAQVLGHTQWSLLVQPRCEDTLNGAVHEAKDRISRRFGRSQDRTISTPHVPLKRIKYVIN